MFTGIILHQGEIEALAITGRAGRVTIHAPSLAAALSVSSSVAVNGCCLTVVAIDNERFSADLSAETLLKTSFGAQAGGLQTGGRVNLEQPLIAGQEFGGHFVLGHVDGVGRVMHLARESAEGESWRYAIEVPAGLARYIVPQGSITIDGISLTVARWHNRIAEVAIIPYTYEHTNIRDRQTGDAVNLEADLLGKYIVHQLEARSATS